MMYERRIDDPDNQGFFNIIHGDDFEYADPEQKILEQFLFANMGFRRREAFMQIPAALAQRMTSNDQKLIMTQVMRKANEDAINEINRLKAVVLPQELLSIFAGLKKRDEEKLFDKFLLMPDVFLNLIMHAGSLGYKYSLYTFKQNPTGTNVNDVPRFAYKDEIDNSIFSTDDTTLSKGQVKALIDQTSSTIVKMLDKGTTWHCFFLTFKGIAGREKAHPPHMHYLSSSWGLTREQVLSELKTKNYTIPSVHVWYDKH